MNKRIQIIAKTLRSQGFSEWQIWHVCHAWQMRSGQLVINNKGWRKYIRQMGVKL